MRPVAIVLICLFFVALVPAPGSASDDCAAAGTQCTSFDVPPTPLQANKQTFYVYAKAATCPMSSACNGSPPAKLLGLVWQETNCVKGLQVTQDVNACGPQRFDTPVLV